MEISLGHVYGQRLQCQCFVMIRSLGNFFRAEEFRERAKREAGEETRFTAVTTKVKSGTNSTHGHYS